MASFSAFLEVGGSTYPLTYYDLYIHQYTDSLGRPASPTLGGTITVELHSPGQSDTVLAEWMLSPTRQYDGFVHLYRDDTKAKLKTISFFNAYLVDMGEHFSASGSGPMKTQLVISPQRVAVGGILHDNNWPVASHGAGVTYAQPELLPAAPANSGLANSLNDGLSSLASMVPPLSKSMDEGKAEPPLDPSRGPDYRPDSQPFDPSRTPDYPSADKPNLPTISDSLERLEAIGNIISSGVDWLTKPDRSGLGEVRGESSGRRYDPDNCGGPIEKLDWKEAEFSEANIATVKKHLSRYGDDPENEAMVERLEKIAAGELEPTDWDRRFLTHEVREYERYKEIGVPDGIDPGREVWNNAHSATLEDFGLSDYDSEGNSNLYHPDVIKL